ncbi:MAG: toll/interleukin-1 receptor domain-containing protein [Sulfurimonas sp.]|jgi:hypothetical protein
MTALQKINLIKEIALALQQQMTFSEIDMFLPHFGIDCKNTQPSQNSKRVYVQEILANEKEETILKIASELNLQHNLSSIKNEILTFWEKGHFRLFITHLAKNKLKASQLQQALKIYGISSFVAHEDIEPSREWQVEIEKALHSMDGLTAILMNGFRESNWCDQEIGFALGKDVLIIPIKKEIDPYGFIGKYQAIQPKNKSVNQVAEEIFKVIVNHEKTRNLMLEKFSSLISNSNHLENSLQQLNKFSKISNISQEILKQMIKELNNNPILSKSENFLDKFRILLKSYNLEFDNHSDISLIDIFDDDIPF